MSKLITKSFIERELGLTQAEFATLCDGAPRCYKYEAHPKANGEHRIISKPYSRIKIHQKKLNKALSELPIEAGICGGPGTTIMAAMKPHCKNPLLLTIDLKNFFPSIDQRRVNDLFAQILDDSSYASSFTKLCTTRRAMPQGAPTSATIARLIIEPAFVDLKKALIDMHPSCEVTAWVDDIMISGPLGIRRAKKTIGKVFERHGFTINHDKTKVMFSAQDRTNLGITLKDILEPSAENLAKYEKCLKETSDKEESIRGYINFFKDIAKANQVCA
ncbi:MAG: hypothetical protein GVY36_16805 [Verrucomicrobia bacterium]|nr:hypothetical protein [Verrucomicrobiota bacterium]